MPPVQALATLLLIRLPVFLVPLLSLLGFGCATSSLLFEEAKVIHLSVSRGTYTPFGHGVRVQNVDGTGCAEYCLLNRPDAADLLAVVKPANFQSQEYIMRGRTIFYLDEDSPPLEVHHGDIFISCLGLKQTPFDMIYLAGLGHLGFHWPRIFGSLCESNQPCSTVQRCGTHRAQEFAILLFDYYFRRLPDVVVFVALLSSIDTTLNILDFPPSSAGLQITPQAQSGPSQPRSWVFAAYQSRLTLNIHHDLVTGEGFNYHVLFLRRVAVSSDDYHVAISGGGDDDDEYTLDRRDDGQFYREHRFSVKMRPLERILLLFPKGAEACQSPGDQIAWEYLMSHVECQRLVEMLDKELASQSPKEQTSEERIVSLQRALQQRGLATALIRFCDSYSPAADPYASENDGVGGGNGRENVAASQPDNCTGKAKRAPRTSRRRGRKANGARQRKHRK